MGSGHIILSLHSYSEIEITVIYLLNDTAMMGPSHLCGSRRIHAHEIGLGICLCCLPPPGATLIISKLSLAANAFLWNFFRFTFVDTALWKRCDIDSMDMI